MRIRHFAFPLLAMALSATPAHALYEGLQCVPFARALTGIEIRGDAHTWWGQAEGRYQRGDKPKVGAVMAFIPHGNMRLGHVAAVRKVIDDRTVLISHANWSTIDGMRGHIEEDVRVIDVSEENDWSRVRVWYTPNSALGGNEWPLHGFIYPDKLRREKEGRAALAAVLAITPRWQPSGRSAMVEPVGPKPQPAKIASASIKPAANVKGFTLSSSFLAEIDKTAKRETKRPGKS
jgi:CHAP domain